MYAPNIKQKINDGISQLEAIADKIPAVVLLHNIKDGAVVWISNTGLKQLNISLAEITKLSAEEYYERFFNAEDAKDYVPKILTLIENNNDEEICTFFQQVRFSANGDYNWHMASTKIFLRDDDGTPLLTITTAVPIDAMHHMATKASRLLDENNFLRKNFKTFSTLSAREQEVLGLMALGKSSIDTAQQLFIAQSTVETHRKNIKQKLNTNSYYELCEYARAFDLI
ncbi:LuxR family transcriptional regulator [Pedobacter frigidisoli]|uniref:LuxR family transcriptional regulator n=1 Tax=Pedobacter frigidisoli TaxID=2530455 RepID=A0A4R0P9F1_9SPHI|nr:helix-turn-helix transcriptional regulator [Pedobacter frigidisoli]TCD12697.1 LuxR family transcriptional regulator [Pedobacter frigidisoli]